MSYPRQICFFLLVFPGTAPYPSGKGVVCKTIMHQFDSDRRLKGIILKYPKSTLANTRKRGQFPIRRFKVSLRKTGDTDSDPYGSKNDTAGLPKLSAFYR